MRNNIINFESIKAGFSKMEVQNNSYVEAVTRTQFCLLGLKDTALPSQADFYEVPENYGGLRKCYDSIQKECVNFTLTIYEKLVIYPNLCLRALQDIARDVESAIHEVNKLSNGGLMQDEIEKATNNLVSHFDCIVNNADHQIECLNSLCSDLKTYSQQNLAALERDFLTLTKELTVDSKNYEAAIKALKKMKKTLADEVKNFRITVAGDVIVSISVLIGGVLSVVAIAISGGSAWPIVLGCIAGGVLFLGTIYGMGYDSYCLQQAKKELEETITQLNGYETDAVLINSTQLQFTKYVDDMIALPETLQTISDAWESVRTGFREIKNRVIDSNAQITDDEWNKMSQLLNECSMLINNQMGMLTDLQIQDTQISNAKLEIGMTKEDIETAIESNPQVSFKEYMLAI